MTRAPLVLFVYRRPGHTLRTLESLSRCNGASETDLVVYSDGPKTTEDRQAVEAVREVCRKATGFRSISVEESTRNRGLADSVIHGVDTVLKRHGSAIVMEDDLVVAHHFLDFLNTALSVYASEKRVFSLSGYSPPSSRVPVPPGHGVWFAPRPSSWGWAIWKDRWDQIDWHITDYDRFSREPRLQRVLERGGRDLSYFLRLQRQRRLDSWAVRMAWTQAKLGALTAYPETSLVLNIGLDGTGTHSRQETGPAVALVDTPVPEFWPPVTEVSETILRRFRRHYEGTWVERWGHRWRKLQKAISGRLG